MKGTNVTVYCRGSESMMHIDRGLAIHYRLVNCDDVARR